jgi:hypothetical protein
MLAVPGYILAVPGCMLAVPGCMLAVPDSGPILFGAGNCRS